MPKRIEEEDRQRKYIENVSNMIMNGNSSAMEQLEEDDEGWTPQAIHDDGSSDSSDEEDYRDESVAQTSTDVEVPTTTQNTIRKESAKGKCKEGSIQMGKNTISSSIC